MFHFGNYFAKSKYYDSNALVVGKIRDGQINSSVAMVPICIVATKEFVGLKLKIYSILKRNSSEYKKQRVSIKIMFLK